MEEGGVEVRGEGGGAATAADAEWGLMQEE